MNEFLLVSTALSWLFILALLIVVLALARQIGVLHERIKPVGALGLGQRLRPGEPAPMLTLPSLAGEIVMVGGPSPDARSTLLFFLSPTCPVCKVLLPVLKSAAASERTWLRVVLASDGDAPAQQSFIARHSLERFPYLLSTSLGLAYQIGKLPYAVLIDAAGTVSSHGLINNREHLESLFESRHIRPEPGLADGSAGVAAVAGTARAAS